MQLEYPGIDFRAPMRIRCVLLPVGFISQEKFDFFASFMERNCSLVNLCDVTRDPNDKTLLQHQRWKETKIEFSFVRAPSTFGALEGRPISIKDDLYNDLEVFQVHKKIVCAIGILHCPSSADPKQDYDEFCKLLNHKYATASVVRCFAMEKDSQEEPVSGCPDMMEIPLCDEAKTRFYYSTLMQDFTYAVLRSFEAELGRKAATPPQITTPLDVDVTERQMRAMQLGRLNKVKGDYCMLAGSSVDALIFYESAKVECKKHNDWVWLAGAQEGCCSAMICNGKDEPAEFITLFQEALSNYNRGKGVALEIEGHLKLAGWFRERGDRLEACNLLMVCHTLGQNESAQNKVVLLTGICSELQQMSFYRKFAFFLRELALLYEQLHMHGMRERMLLIAAPFYQLHELGPVFTPEEDAAMGQVAISKRNGWELLSALVLLELSKVADARDDSMSYVRYITYVLRAFPTTTSAKSQKDLANFLLAHTRKLLPCICVDMRELPLVRSIEALPAQNVEVQSTGGAATPGRGGAVFIFNPAAAKKGPVQNWTEIVWVQGEVATVRIALKNDRDFNIHIERIQLLTRGAPFESYSASLSVPARSNKVMHLSGVPLISGNDPESDYLVITGVEIQAFHIIGVHHVDHEGRNIENDRLLCDERFQNPASVIGPMRVQVAKPLPSLRVESALFNGNHLQILEGVYSYAVISFVNSGKVPVEWIRLTVQENLSAKPGLFQARSSVFTLNGADCSQVNLLSPGQILALDEHLKVQLDVYGLVGAIGASFVIEYGAHSQELDAHCRAETHHIPIFVHKGLEITSLNVELCNFSATQMPALFQLEDASHLKGKSLSMLVLEVSNSAKTAFSVSITVDSVAVASDNDFVCSPGSSRLFILPIARHWIPDEELEDVPVPKGQFIRAKQDMTPLQALALKLEYNYKKHLQKIVKLEWKSTNNQSGFLSLHGVRVGMDEVRKIMPAPLTYSLDEGEEMAIGLWERSEKVGTLVELRFGLQNETHGSMASAFRLNLIEQDLEELKRANFLIVSGLLEKSLSFEAGQKQVLSFQFCFLVPGEYSFKLLATTDSDLNKFCISPIVNIKVY